MLLSLTTGRSVGSSTQGVLSAARSTLTNKLLLLLLPASLACSWFGTYHCVGHSACLCFQLSLSIFLYHVNHCVTFLSKSEDNICLLVCYKYKFIERQFTQTKAQVWNTHTHTHTNNLWIQTKVSNRSTCFSDRWWIDSSQRLHTNTWCPHLQKSSLLHETYCWIRSHYCNNYKCSAFFFSSLHHSMHISCHWEIHSWTRC